MSHVFICLVQLVISLLVSHHVTAYDYYVSKNGSDAGDGSMSKPWATIQTAQANIQQLIRSLSKNSFDANITLHIEGSSDAYEAPLVFGVDDSMTGFKRNNYVIYKSINIDNPVYVYGAYDITTTWTKSMQNGLNLYSTNLKPQQSQLPANGKIYELFMRSGRVSMSKSMVLTYNFVNIPSKSIVTNTTMIPNIADIMSTDYSMNLMVLVYEHWTSSYHQVKNIDYVPSSGRITLTLNTCPSQYVNDAASGNRFYLLNNVHLLRNNNQFYYNRTNMNLYLLTNATITTSEPVRFAKDAEVITMKGESADNKVERIMLKGLHLKYSAIDFNDCLAGVCMDQSASFLQTATVHTMNVYGIILDSVDVSQTGGYAIWLDEGTTNTQVINSKIYHVGAGGIRIGVHSGGEVPEASLTKGILVSNNYIMNGGYVYESGCGILAQSFADTNITHNEIANFKYTGISTGWTWDYEATSVSNNIVAYNLIYNIGQHVLSDMGCIYTLGRQLNCVYDNNICHDVYSFDYGGWGTYTDQASRFLLWRNNIVYKTNIVYTNDTWNYDILSDPMNTLWKNMTLDGNTYWSVRQGANLTFPDAYSISEWTAEGKDVQNALQDPMFVDPINYNFDIKLGSPAISLGFHPIDTQNVGPN
eukprot:21102_1